MLTYSVDSKSFVDSSMMDIALSATYGSPYSFHTSCPGRKSYFQHVRVPMVPSKSHRHQSPLYKIKTNMPKRREKKNMKLFYVTRSIVSNTSKYERKRHLDLHCTFNYIGSLALVFFLNFGTTQSTTIHKL